MKPYILLLFVFTLPFYCVSQQIDFDNSVRFYAEDVGKGLLLKWVNEVGVNNYIISRRDFGETSYKLLANIPASKDSYLDTTVVEQQLYEYKIAKSKSNGTVFGFLSGGIKVHEYYNRPGYILLLIKSNIAESLAFEIERYENDLQKEAWATLKTIISDTHDVEDVKTIIKDYYSNYPGLKSVVLVGNIPVPYSGLINPDGHPDHYGAWPCDAFYADMDGLWTDANANNDMATGFRNDNVPDDGKYDQSTIGKVELEIGRIDLSNLPAFTQSEIELTKNYFNKNHDFRTGKTKFKNRGLIQNNFPSFAEAFGQSGVNNFSRMFGPDSIFYLPYKSTLQTDDYLWSYGCGPGNYTGAGGIGNTFELVNENHKTVFTMVFGSYFGDWDNENNYLRAALASGQTLTNVWAGRPHWYFQHMAMGFNIGYSTKVTQNNNGEFPTGAGGKGVHIALMGDPSLIMTPFKAIDTVSYTTSKNVVTLSWQVNDTTDIVGYELFAKNNDQYYNYGGVTRNVYSIEIPCLPIGEYDFLIKAKKIIRTASGSFIQNSIAKSIKIIISEYYAPSADFVTNVYFDLLNAKPMFENCNFNYWSINDLNSVDTILSNLFNEDGLQKICLSYGNYCESNLICKDIITTSSLPDYDVISTNALCHDDTITNEIKIIQENAPFNVVWDNGVEGLTNSDITTSSIGFTITTSTGRMLKVFALNDFPEKIVISGTVTSEIENVSKGRIQIDVTGGSPPFKYIINGDTASNGDFTELPAGEYTIEIYDANNCKESKTFIVQFSTGTDEERFNHSTVRLMYDESGIYIKDLVSDTNINNVSLFSISGQKIGNFTKIIAKDEWQFDHGNMPMGVYLIQIDKAGKKVIKKWIK